MPIKHAFTSPKADPADATLIKPSNWNADHEYPAFTAFAMQFGDDPWTTQAPPAGIDEVYSVDFRGRVDLTNALQARVVGNVTLNAGGVAAARLAVQYSLDQAVWAYLDAASGPNIPLTPIGRKMGAWVTITPAARADVWLRWITVNGNGLNLQWHHHYLQVR